MRGSGHVAWRRTVACLMSGERMPVAMVAFAVRPTVPISVGGVLHRTALNSCAFFTTIVLLNCLLLSLLDCSPIGNVLDVKYHVSSKDKLSWRRLLYYFCELFRAKNIKYIRVVTCIISNFCGRARSFAPGLDGGYRMKQVSNLTK